MGISVALQGLKSACYTRCSAEG